MAYDEDLVERIREVIATTRGVTEKRMFGGLAFLVDGHMTVAAKNGDGLLARCDPADTEALVTKTPDGDGRARDERLAEHRRRGPTHQTSAGTVGETRSGLRRLPPAQVIPHRV